MIVKSMITAQPDDRARSGRGLAWALAVLVASMACKGEPAHKSVPASVHAPAPAGHTRDAGAQALSALPGKAPASEPCADLEPVPTRVSAPRRLVAIGDLHGDLGAARAVFQLAGAVDEKGHWIGGELVVVQTGDLLDRGNDEQALLDWLAGVRDEALAAGGAVYVLNGNHELMNAIGDFRYVTPAGFEDFQDVPGLDLHAPELAPLDPRERARAAAFLPGGPYARRLAQNNVVMIVGDTAFVHGGILPEHVDAGLEHLNREVRCWLAHGGAVPSAVTALDSPVWIRDYSLDPPACRTLARALARLGAARMVVGHTTQKQGITSACEGRVWRIDTGLAAHYGGVIQALEIHGGKTVKVLGR